MGSNQLGAIIPVLLRTPPIIGSRALMALMTASRDLKSFGGTTRPGETGVPPVKLRRDPEPGMAHDY